MHMYNEIYIFNCVTYSGLLFVIVKRQYTKNRLISFRGNHFFCIEGLKCVGSTKWMFRRICKTFCPFHIKIYMFWVLWSFFVSLVWIAQILHLLDSLQFISLTSQLIKNRKRLATHLSHRLYIATQKKHTQQLTQAHKKI